METTRLSSKGQIILPKAVRDFHRWGPGTDFVVEDLAGCLKGEGPSLTLEAMGAAIDAEVQVRRDRSRY